MMMIRFPLTVLMMMMTTMMIIIIIMNSNNKCSRRYTIFWQTCSSLKKAITKPLKVETVTRSHCRRYDMEEIREDQKRGRVSDILPKITINVSVPILEKSL